MLYKHRKIYHVNFSPDRQIRPKIVLFITFFVQKFVLFKISHYICDVFEQHT